MGTGRRPGAPARRGPQLRLVDHAPGCSGWRWPSGPACSSARSRSTSWRRRSSPPTGGNTVGLRAPRRRARLLPRRRGDRPDGRRRTASARAAPRPRARPFGIVLGAVLDGIPESIVLGRHPPGEREREHRRSSPRCSSRTSRRGWPAAPGSRRAGWATPAHLRAVGAGRPRVRRRSSALGYVALDGASPEITAFTLAFAGGAVLTMLADTMMPEAFEHGGRVVGLLTTVGFGVAFFLHTLGLEQLTRRASSRRGGSPRGRGSPRARPPWRRVMKRRTSVGSLTPGADSTPLATSTPHGRTRSIASATLSGVRPPARSTRRPDGAPSARDQSNTCPEPGALGVDHHDVGTEGRRSGEVAVAAREGLDDHRHPLADPAGVRVGLVAVQLGAAQAGVVGELDHPLAGLVTEDADGEDLRGQPLHDVGGARHREEAGRRRHEVEADRVGAHGHREERVLLRRDAAHLDEHAVEATDEARGDRRPIAPDRGAVTSDSPTRTAWNPASASRRASAGPAMPDSATRTTPVGHRRRRRARPGRCRPRRSPGRAGSRRSGRRPTPSARSSSASSWTSTSASSSSSPAMAWKSISSWSSRAATMSSTASAPMIRARTTSRGSTVKSLRRTGRSTAWRAARRSSAEPPNHCSSVSTDRQAAPPRA